jgi:aspartyl/asparaginyl beta-hydroxylase (cupin superfamily)
LATRRLETFIEAMAGRRKIYHQEPVNFHYPGLPAIEFFERDAFPWLEALEDRTDAICQELLAVWTEGSPELTPYVNYRDGIPLDQWAELNRSLNWSAYHLYLDGAPVEAHCRDCPETMAALALVEQPRIIGRSPSAMFSILRPRTRIPPHTGVANTRLVVHLPLVVSDGCGFRVGGETREWREGEAWVFDDTIEHEAWNNSDLPRAVLIFDVWNPLLPPAERDLVVRLTAAMDRFNAASDGGS